MALSFIWLIQFRIADFIAFWNIVAGGPKPKNVFLLSILNSMKWTIIFYYDSAEEIKHQPAAEQNFLFTTPQYTDFLGAVMA